MGLSTTSTNNTVIQLDLYCGLITGDDPRTAPVNRGYAHRLALEAFPFGHTIIEAQGRWDQGGVPITEPTLIIRLFLDEKVPGDEAKARRLAGAYKHAAKQEAVMIIKTNIDVDLV